MIKSLIKNHIFVCKIKLCLSLTTDLLNIYIPPTFSIGFTPLHFCNLCYLFNIKNGGVPEGHLDFNYSIETFGFSLWNSAGTVPEPPN